MWYNFKTMGDERSFSELFADYHGRIVEGGDEEVRKIVREIGESWKADFVRLENPHPLPLKPDPELKTETQRLTAIENGLTFAARAVREG